MKHPKNFVDRSGLIYGRLTVIEYAGFSSQHQGAMWKCICTCGTISLFQGKLLARGKTNSCGCLIREVTGNRSRTHGLSKTVEYDTFHRIKKRCYDNKHPDYKDYGGRGIVMDDRWINSFENFFEDMGRKPSPTHSIERIDVNGNYEPSNCKWATPKEQASNRRNTRNLTHEGKTLTITEWARRFGLHQTTLRRRLDSGISPEIALSKPSMHGQRDYSKLSFNGESLTIAEWGRRFDLQHTTIKRRLKAGWETEIALKTPMKYRRSK